MTRRGDREASERRSEIGKNERQPVMAQLAALWRRANLVILITLKKGNHRGEEYVSRHRRKALYRRERDSLEDEEAEIQCKALRRGKNLAFSEDTCLEKERVRSKVTPRKVGVGLKQRRELNRRRLGWRLAWWGSTEKNQASHFLGLRGRHQYSDQRSNRNGTSCVASTAVGTEGEEDQMARSSAQREQLTEEDREAGGSLMKREKSTEPRTDPCGTPRRTLKERLL